MNLRKIAAFASYEHWGRGARAVPHVACSQGTAAANQILRLIVYDMDYEAIWKDS